MQKKKKNHVEFTGTLKKDQVFSSVGLLLCSTAFYVGQSQSINTAPGAWKGLQALYHTHTHTDCGVSQSQRTPAGCVVDRMMDACLCTFTHTWQHIISGLGDLKLFRLNTEKQFDLSE